MVYFSMTGTRKIPRKNSYGVAGNPDGTIRRVGITAFHACLQLILIAIWSFFIDRLPIWLRFSGKIPKPFIGKNWRKVWPKKLNRFSGMKRLAVMWITIIAS